MKILNFGSLNIDKVYSVQHIVTPGETISCTRYEDFCGGKGLNQSIAVARAGQKVWHAGAVGPDGDMLLDILRESGADTSLVRQLPGPSGHALIQVNEKGQNCIIVYGGTNTQITEADVDEVLAHFSSGDIVILQNEISCIGYIMQQAHARGMKIVLNPSPIDSTLLACPLELVDVFMLNEIEGATLSGRQDFGEVLDGLHEKYPAADIVLTLGSEGVLYRSGDRRLSHPIFRVPVVDTTAAGDTFCGYFVACMAQGIDAERALELASAASAIAVSRAGAAPSIPTMQEVEAFLRDRH